MAFLKKAVINIEIPEAHAMTYIRYACIGIALLTEYIKQVIRVDSLMFMEMLSLFLSILKFL